MGQIKIITWVGTQVSRWSTSGSHRGGETQGAKSTYATTEQTFLNWQNALLVDIKVVCVCVCVVEKCKITSVGKNKCVHRQTQLQ